MYHNQIVIASAMKETPRRVKLTGSNPVDKFLFFSDATYIAPSVIGIDRSDGDCCTRVASVTGGGSGGGNGIGGLEDEPMRA